MTTGHFEPMTQRRKRIYSVIRLARDVGLSESAGAYEQLPSGPYIRVLSALPRNNSGIEDRYMLRVRYIDEGKPFIALSYRWTKEKAEKPITINDEPVEVQVTVKHFLNVHFRRQDCKEIFIDSLCIDQDNLTERSHQVGLMAAVYSKATKVCVWLGKSICCTDKTLHMLRDFQTVKRSSGNWASWVDQTMDHLFAADYWTRTWIVQELLLARSIEVLCGAEFVPTGLLRAWIRSMSERSWKELRIGDYEMTRCNAYRLLEQRNKWITQPLAKVLLRHSHTVSTDVRDQVYALLGICSDVNGQHVLNVDYSTDTTAETLFFDVMKFVDVHADWVVPYAHFSRSLLRLTGDRFCDKSASRWGAVRARAWKVCVVCEASVPLGNAMLPSFRISHAYNRLRRMDRSSFGRNYEELLLESAHMISKTLERLDVPTQLETKRLDCHEAMRIMALSEEKSTNALDKLHGHLPAPKVVQGAGAGMSQYKCRQLTELKINEEDNSYTNAASTSAFQPGDTVCRFLGLDIAFVIRKHDDNFRLVGKAYLDDEHHQDFWQGQAWVTAFDKPREPFPMPPKHLESIDFVMDWRTLFDICG